MNTEHKKTKNILSKQFLHKVYFCAVYPFSYQNGVAVLFLVLSASVAVAQKKGILPVNMPKKDSLEVSLPDSLKKNSPDQFQYTVVYASRDSSLLDNTTKVLELFGEAKVTYNDIKLEADYIRLNLERNEVFATGKIDTTGKSRKRIGFPVFMQGSEKYDADSIRYNFKTRKAIIRETITQQGEGNVRGKTVKKDSSDNLYIRSGFYTTCNLAHPHFGINASKIKLVNNKAKGSKQVIVGPFNMVLNEIPLPVGFLFGFFPVPKQKQIGTSGIQFPQYGEEPRGRGFFLRDGGYYFAINEHVNAVLSGSIYSKGGWGLGATSSYSKRYRYSGSFALNYSLTKTGDEADPNASGNFQLTWSHQPVARNGQSFSANVNLASNDYSKLNALNNSAYLQNTINSGIQYSKTFGKFARASTSLRLNQNVSTKVLDVGTDFSLGLNQVTPFKRKKAVGTPLWYESFRVAIDLSGSFSVSNQLSFNAISPYQFKVINVAKADTTKIQQTTSPFGVPQNAPAVMEIKSLADINKLLERGLFRGRFSVPITLPNFKIGKYINLTPGMNLQGDLFTQKLGFTYDATKQGVRVDTTKGLYFPYTYSFNTSLNTRFYGTLQFKKTGRIQAIRHTVVPSVSLSYAPDFSKPSYGFYQSVQTNSKNDRVVQSVYAGYGGAPGAVGSIGFSLVNTLEMKVRSHNDTTGKGFDKISIFDNLSFSGGYNMLLDTLKLSDIAIGATTNLFKKINISFNGTLAPYQFIETEGMPNGKKVNRLWIEKGKLGDLQNINVSVSTHFQPQAKEKKTPADASNTELKDIKQNPNEYVDFDLPWKIDLSYQLGFTKYGLGPAQTFNGFTVNGSLSLTPKWQIQVNSGYDMVRKAVTYTTVNVTRDLHCWAMSFNWNPVGLGFRANTYSFEIKAKSSLLQDLKLSRRRSFIDRGGFY